MTSKEITANGLEQAVKRFRLGYTVDDVTGCWVWRSANGSSRGYGQFKFNRKNMGAHRFSYEQERGKIPAGLTIDHLCRNRKCVNPSHLEAVTNQENLLRGKHIKPCIHGLRAVNHCKTCLMARKAAQKREYYAKAKGR